MNLYLKLHREMLRFYSRHEAAKDWPSEEIRRCTHALAWTLYSMGAARKDDKDAIKKYLDRAVADLERARAAGKKFES